MPVIGPVMQIIAAFIIVVFLFAVGFLIFNMEIITSLNDAGKLKKNVPIFTGMADLSPGNTGVFTTMNPKESSYREIVPSVNQPSGAEFAYNFWLYKDNNAFHAVTTDGSRIRTDTGLTQDDFILFVHGERTAVDITNNLCGRTKRDIAVKCPLVKLERAGTMLTVELNTVASIDAVREQSRNTCTDDSRDWYAMNAHKIAIYTDQSSNAQNYDKKWFMVSIVFNDTSPSDPLPLRNKCRCRIYINGNIELDRYLDDKLGVQTSQSLIRRNNGNLYLSPKVALSNAQTTTQRLTDTSPSNKVLMADLTYYNYAVAEDEIKNLFNNGFTKSWAVIGESKSDVLSDFTSSDKMSLASSTRQFNAF
jgi:hypothetical protein